MTVAEDKMKCPCGDEREDPAFEAVIIRDIPDGFPLHSRVSVRPWLFHQLFGLSRKVWHSQTRWHSLDSHGRRLSTLQDKQKHSMMIMKKWLGRPSPHAPGQVEKM